MGEDSDTSNDNASMESYVSAVPSVNINRDRILLHIFFRNYRAERYHRLTSRMYPLLFIMFLPGIVFLVLTFANQLPSPYYAFLSFLMLPACFMRLLSFSTEMFLRLLRTYEAWYLVVNIVGGAVSSFYVFNFDARCAGPAAMVPPLISVAFYDAAIHLTSRTKIPFAVIGALTAFVITALLAFGITTPTGAPRVTILSFNYDATNIAISCFINIALLCGRYAVVFMRGKRATAVLRSNYLNITAVRPSLGNAVDPSSPLPLSIPSSGQAADDYDKQPHINNFMGSHQLDISTT